MTLRDFDRALKALVLGDLLTTVLLRVRPYETARGAANALYDIWVGHCCDYLAGSGQKTYGFNQLIDQIVSEFDRFELRSIPRKPRVGLVGEILVKFQILQFFK